MVSGEAAGCTFLPAVTIRKQAQSMPGRAPPRGCRCAAKSELDMAGGACARVCGHGSLLCLLVLGPGETWMLGAAGTLVPREKDLWVGEEVNIDQ